MPDINLSFAFNSSNQMDEGQIQQIFLDTANKYIEHVKFFGNPPERFMGRIRTSILNPVVSVVGEFKAHADESKGKVTVDVSIRPNGWMWFMLATSVVATLFYFPLFWLWFGIDIVLYIYQKNRTLERMREAFEEFKFRVQEA